VYVIIRKNLFLGNIIDFMKSTGCGWEEEGVFYKILAIIYTIENSEFIKHYVL
jgi:hypothetical protein